MKFRKPIEVLLIIITAYLSFKMFFVPEEIGYIMCIVIVININLLGIFGKYIYKLQNKLDAKLSKYVELR